MSLILRYIFKYMIESDQKKVQNVRQGRCNSFPDTRNSSCGRMEPAGTLKISEFEGKIYWISMMYFKHAMYFRNTCENPGAL